jgi:L-aspartate oxidase
LPSFIFVPRRLRMKIARYISSMDNIQQVIQTDCVVVGAGIAGLYTALQLSEKAEVTLITKKSLVDSNTRWAQGGIAAVVSELDSANLHKQDTLMAGAGLCDSDRVDILVNEGPEGVRQLIEYGINFDEENGQIALTKEGAHSRHRILHARGDATGAEIIRGLSHLVRKNKNIIILENHYTFDLITHDGQCQGVLALNPHQKKMITQAKSVVLATGGAGQLYRYTTNPDIATGDGVALAYRAGAEIQDMEFIQFHPTVLFYPEAPRFLISEAVRGEGAILRNTHGEAFMEKYHSLADLAPRDVVSRAIVSEIEKAGNQYVYLDFTHEPEDKIKKRFPTIYKTCLKYGLNLGLDWLPVAPAAHYSMGGVKTNSIGETNIKGLYACGETACTGVHGANRLASNSLSEAIVFGKRIAQHNIEHHLSRPQGPSDLLKSMELATRQAPDKKQDDQPVMERRLKLQKMMLQHASLKRDKKSLQELLAEIHRWLERELSYSWEKKEELEYINLLTCSLFVVHSALLREESRGGHFRTDFPVSDDQNWRKHIILVREEDTGIVKERYTDVKPS